MRIPKSLKICGAITLFLILSVTIVILVMWFAVIKPRQPKITMQPVTLENINLIIFPFHLDLTLGLNLTVENPNHASFRYDNTTAYVSYRGSPVGEAPIVNDTVPARGKHDINTELVVDVDSLVSNAGFQGDVDAGCLNFTSATTLHGRAKVLNLFKVKAITYSTCDISVYIVSQNASSVCKSKFKFRL